MSVDLAWVAWLVAAIAAAEKLCQMSDERRWERAKEESGSAFLPLGTAPSTIYKVLIHGQSLLVNMRVIDCNTFRFPVWKQQSLNNRSRSLH